MFTKLLRGSLVFFFTLTLLSFFACATGNDSLYRDESIVGEAQQEELAAARRKLDEARERRRQGQGTEQTKNFPASPSAVAIQEMPAPSPRNSRDGLEGEPLLGDEEQALYDALPPEEPSLSENSKNLSSVEILWARTDSAVAGYLIRYGFDRENLSEEIRIDASEVETREDPEHGPVNSFILRNIPKKQNVFVSLASVGDGNSTNEGVSAFSEVLELQAE